MYKSRETGEEVALKEIDKTKLTGKEKEFLKEEIQIIRQIRHPNVVEMKDVFENKTNILIAMECVQGGELFEHIKNFQIKGNIYFYY